MGVRVSVGPEGSLDFFGLADQQRPESKFHSSVFEWVEDRGLYLSQKGIFSCPSSPIFSGFVLETLVFSIDVTGNHNFSLGDYGLFLQFIHS